MKKIFVIAAVASLYALPMSVSAHESVYWQDSSGSYVKDGSGKCVRGSHWAKGSQIEGCDEIAKPAPMPAPKPMVMAPADGDGDGVPDSKDACKFTPAGTAVDARGCTLDADKDGVADAKDQCPNTPKDKEVDDKGCELVQFKTVSVKLEVQFPSNSDKVSSAYDTQMKALAYVLGADKSSSVVIKGHTDSAGSAAYNKSLSQRRAEAVAQHLISNYGVAASQVSAQGFGEEMPVADNATAEGRAANRRVEAEMQGKVKK